MKENDREDFNVNALLFRNIPLTVRTVPMIVKSTIAWILEEEQIYMNNKGKNDE